MKRLLASLAVALALASGALGQTRILPAPEIRGNDVTFGSVLRLGTRINGVYTSTPDRLQILGSGSTGDVSAMSVTPTNGGVARALTDLFSTQLYAVNFGVIPGAANSGPQMRNAFARAQAIGARLILPPGVINVCGGTDPEALLRIELSMSLVGDSRQSRIEPCADAGDRAILMVKPLTNNGGISGMVLKDFTIGIPGVQRTAGGDAILINTANLGGFVSKLLMENVGTSTKGKGFYGFRHSNPYTEDANGVALTGNKNGGLYSSTIRDSVITGGMKFTLTGDSNNIERNLINGPNEGIYYNPIFTGAATHRITGNNITATGDSIVFENGIQGKFTQNQIEGVGTYTGNYATRALIRVINSIDVVIRDNNLNAYTGADAVVVSGSQGVRVEPNSATYAPDRYLFVATNSPNNVVERQIFEMIGTTPSVGRSRVSVDAASPTIGVWQQLTLQNGWNATGTNASFRQGLWWMPLADGTIRLSGSIANGTTTAGTTLATLPASFRPVSAVRFMGLAYLNNIVNGSPWAVGVYLVNGNGDIQVQFLPTLAPNAGTFISFDGTSFSIRP